MAKIDFSRHELIIEQDKYCQIINFINPHTTDHDIVLVNARGVCTVTGVFGTWVFNQCLEPLKNQIVNRQYLDGKIEHKGSTQKVNFFDKDLLREKCEKVRDYYYSKHKEPICGCTKQWLSAIQLSANYDSLEAAYYNDYPYYSFDEDFDTDFLIEKTRHPSLDAIYDALNAMSKLI